MAEISKTLEQELEEMKRQEAAAKALKPLVDYINGAHPDDITAVVNQLLLSTHRTLQQKLFGLFLEYTYALAETEYFDGRNEYSKEVAQKIKNLLGKNGHYMPLI